MGAFSISMGTSSAALGVILGIVTIMQGNTAHRKRGKGGTLGRLLGGFGIALSLLAILSNGDAFADARVRNTDALYTALSNAHYTVEDVPYDEIPQPCRTDADSRRLPGGRTATGGDAGFRRRGAHPGRQHLARRPSLPGKHAARPVPDAETGQQPSFALYRYWPARQARMAPAASCQPT